MKTLQGTVHLLAILPALLAAGCGGSGSTTPAVPAPVASFSFNPPSPLTSQSIGFTDTSTHSPTSWAWTFGDGGTSSMQNPAHAYVNAGTYTISLTATNGAGSGSTSRTITVSSSSTSNTYPIVDTHQTIFYNASTVLSPAPASSSSAFYGQDAQFSGLQPSYRNNGDGTISDLNTGLMWVKARGAQVTLSAAIAGAATCNVGGHTDWRMPNVKELYSLILFSGADGMSMTDPTGYIPFIDSTVFDFVYGPGTGTTTGQRLIDCQDWSATQYVSTTMKGDPTDFGVNFGDGHIKGYGIYQAPANTVPLTKYVRYVRSNTSYGVNHFQDNGDGTITDRATGLMWARGDSGVGMNWQAALAWVQTQNGSNALGHSDWRLPNVKELQSLVDYTRSPDTSGTAAIDPLFTCTPITNEGGKADFPCYWTGTTINDNSPSLAGLYIAFGRALGWMKAGSQSYYTLLDVHGAGAQRSDPKSGNVTSYYLGTDASGNPAYGRGPQGDVVRIANYVRLVRTAN